MKRGATLAVSTPTLFTDLDEESGIRVRPPSVVSDAIASGGMASVHLVASGDDGRLFAVKRLHPHLAKDEYFTSMLLDEATLAAAIRHENVVTTYGIDHYEGTPCVVMDYVPGLSASDVIRLAHPAGVPIPFALKIAADALRGLHAAHEACDAFGRPLQIVHRDVSPQNILVGADGVTRMLDFGIAKAAHRIHSTRPGDVKGKLAYMSPEQLMGADVDRRSDLRAVGVVLWEMLTGAPLFHMKREEDTVEKIIRGRVRRPSELVSDLPAEIDAIVMRALSLHPADRFATALEMAQAIEAVAFRYFVTARQVGEWVHSIGFEVLDERERVSANLQDTISFMPTLVRPSQAPAPEPKRAWTPKRLFSRLSEPALLVFSALLVAAGSGFYLTRARIIRK
ncbi:MAG: serine/threonine-protein kinase [Labilithrix sp.]